jgi:hypothetical protein
MPKKKIDPAGITEVDDLCALNRDDPPFSFLHHLGLPGITGPAAAPTLSAFFGIGSPSGGTGPGPGSGGPS